MVSEGQILPQYFFMQNNERNDIM